MGRGAKSRCARATAGRGRRSSRGRAPPSRRARARGRGPPSSRLAT